MVIKKIMQLLCQSKTRELGVAEHVIYAGFRKDVPAVMKASDVLILPLLMMSISIKFYEQCGLVEQTERGAAVFT